MQKENASKPSKNPCRIIYSSIYSTTYTCYAVTKTFLRSQWSSSGYFSIHIDHTLCWTLITQAQSRLYPSVSIVQTRIIANCPSLLPLSMSQEWVVPLMACFCPRTSIRHFIPGDTFQGIKTIAVENNSLWLSVWWKWWCNSINESFLKKELILKCSLWWRRQLNLVRLKPGSFVLKKKGT